MEKERQNYIKKAFEEIQIFLNEEQIQQFASYYEILIQKNEVMNLTAITEFEDVVRKHFVDSLTIKNLLEEAPVDYTCAVSMGAITKLVDAVGGVDIVMSNNYSIPDENWVDFIHYDAGSTVHMDGETAYRFIHYRDVEHLYTNLDRMNRQQDFLTAFTAALKETIKSRPWKIPGLLKELKPYYYTDLPFTEMLRLAVTALFADLSEIERIQIPGTEVHVGRYDQYLPEEEKLREMMLEIFYEKQR